MFLEMRNVTKHYPGQSRAVLDGINLSLNEGQSLALTGDSGSGKSTLLHLAAALDHCDSGEVLISGTILSGNDSQSSQIRRSLVSLVFQQFNLIPSLNVDQNLSLHARLAGRFERAWFETLVERLGLTEFLDRFPEQLSGGQQQRVAIGRALTMQPRLLLADEPTGNLDETASSEVMDLMLDLVSETGTALLLVTHAPAIAARLEQHFHLASGKLQQIRGIILDDQPRQQTAR